MKTCPKCKEEKPSDLFGRNRSKNDGLSSWCKSCKYSSEKAYAATDAGKKSKAKAKKKYWASDKGKAVTAKANAKYDSNNRKKRAVYWGIYRALKTGKLQRLTCQECGDDGDIAP